MQVKDWTSTFLSIRDYPFRRVLVSSAWFIFAFLPFFIGENKTENEMIISIVFCIFLCGGGFLSLIFFCKIYYIELDKQFNTLNIKHFGLLGHHHEGYELDQIEYASLEGNQEGDAWRIVIKHRLYGELPLIDIYAGFYSSQKQVINSINQFLKNSTLESLYENTQYFD